MTEGGNVYLRCCFFICEISNKNQCNPLYREHGLGEWKIYSCERNRDLSLSRQAGHPLRQTSYVGCGRGWRVDVERSSAAATVGWTPSSFHSTQSARGLRESKPLHIMQCIQHDIVWEWNYSIVWLLLLTMLPATLLQPHIARLEAP